jgi:hypothetical protein
VCHVSPESQHATSNSCNDVDDNALGFKAICERFQSEKTRPKLLPKPQVTLSSRSPAAACNVYVEDNAESSANSVAAALKAVSKSVSSMRPEAGDTENNWQSKRPDGETRSGTMPVANGIATAQKETTTVEVVYFAELPESHTDQVVRYGDHTASRGDPSMARTSCGNTEMVNNYYYYY